MTKPKKTAAAPAKDSRDGRVMIAGHFAPAVQRELKILAVRESTTVLALLTEAITDLFKKRGLPSVAQLEKETK